MGMISVGQPFPFWVRDQTPLRLKASSAVPADLVRLAAGVEIAVAPRVRQRKPVPGASLPRRSQSEEQLPLAVWLRVQVGQILIVFL